MTLKKLWRQIQVRVMQKIAADLMRHGSGKCPFCDMRNPPKEHVNEEIRKIGEL